ncbi:S41 family peptidase [Brevundimonas sp.]|uniref:S41 family peptidase n=1 Tax=Brevundimonas sp. TaxID=1871086 RepID=UPI0025E4D460|nr:S41 family peptidase [Brevundimonas sp.]
MKLRALILAAALALPGGPAPAQDAARPRAVVEAIAERIRDQYFSIERGDAIADALEAESASGRYDAFTDPRDLAAELSARLRPEDAHFVVLHDPAGPAASPGSGGVRSQGTDIQRLSNYGFTRVEVLPGNIGLIEMRSFANIDFGNPDDPARRAADAALALVAHTDAVIFDVRNNGGGSPAMVGYLVSAFTPPDADIYNVFHNRDGTRRETPRIYYSAPRLETPLYVLTSARSGSAAEAFPYTLQAAGRATIVGETTGGASNPGGMFPIPGGFMVFISGGSPVNPITGRNWEGTGVIPDVEAPAALALNHAQRLALGQILAEQPDRTDAAWALSAFQTWTGGPVALNDYAGTYGPLAVANEDEALVVRRGRRPPMVLTPVETDLFFVAGDPLMRFAFERDASGRVIAIEQRPAFGPGMRQRRTD